MKFQKPKIYNDIKSPEKRAGFWKAVFRIFTVEFASLSILEILVFLLIVGGGIFYIRNIVQESYEDRLREKITALEELKNNLERSAYDKVRISDTTNILLALQDYNFEKGNLPQNLSALKNGVYLVAGDISDPEFGKPYYYQRKSPTDYVLCIYLSTDVWGTNIADCPSQEEFVGEPILLLEGAAPAKNVEETSTPPAQTATPAEQITTLTITETETGWLRVRETSALNARILTRVYSGEKYQILEEKEEWAKIKLSAPVKLGGETFDSGWVSKEYTIIR